MITTKGAMSNDNFWRRETNVMSKNILQIVLIRHSAQLKCVIELEHLLLYTQLNISSEIPLAPARPLQVLTNYLMILNTSKSILSSVSLLHSFLHPFLSSKWQNHEKQLNRSMHYLLNIVWTHSNPNAEFYGIYTVGLRINQLKFVKYKQKLMSVQLL